MNSIKSVAVSAIIAFCSVSAFSKGSSHVEEVQTNQSAVYASERVLIVREARASYAPNYRPMVCLPNFERLWSDNNCTDSNGKNAWQYMSDVAPVGFKFSRFFKPDRYTVFIVFEPK